MTLKALARAGASLGMSPEEMAALFGSTPEQVVEAQDGEYVFDARGRFAPSAGDRYKAIAEFAAANPSYHIVELAEHFDVSCPTVSRALKAHGVRLPRRNSKGDAAPAEAWATYDAARSSGLTVREAVKVAHAAHADLPNIWKLNERTAWHRQHRRKKKGLVS